MASRHAGSLPVIGPPQEVEGLSPAVRDRYACELLPAAWKHGERLKFSTGFSIRGENVRTASLTSSVEWLGDVLARFGVNLVGREVRLDPEWPHEYIVRGRVDEVLFERLLVPIRGHGVEGRFYTKVITYYEDAGRVYGRWVRRSPRRPSLADAGAKTPTNVAWRREPCPSRVGLTLGGSRGRRVQEPALRPGWGATVHNERFRLA
jgi:hypothetical protein